MVQSLAPASTDQIAKHYDELDKLYRAVWGEHLHHGWFESIWDSRAQATERLSYEVARRLNLKERDRVCDVGCGYGATAEILAHKYRVRVTGITISPSQFSVAQAKQSEHLKFRMMDWLQNDFADASFDHLLSIESSEHMPNKPLFFQEAHRVLKSKGRFVICAWLASENPSPWQEKHLLEPICQEGRIPSLATKSEYLSLFSGTGFDVESYSDITSFVKRTWTICILNLASHFIKQPTDLKLLIPTVNSNANFLKSLFRIRWAYETGAMKYGIFKAVKQNSAQVFDRSNF